MAAQCGFSTSFNITKPFNHRDLLASHYFSRSGLPRRLNCRLKVFDVHTIATTSTSTRVRPFKSILLTSNHCASVVEYIAEQLNSVF